MRQNEDIRTTVFITFPRSGHNYLMGVLFRYFEKVGKNPGYCEYYTHCKTFPCTDQKNRMMKNHDFGLKLRFDSRFNYVIQLRHPYLAIQSLFELEQVNTGSMPTEKTFDQFLRKNAAYYRKFCKKWLSCPGATVVKYEDLIVDPFSQAKRIIDSMAGDTDDECLQKSIEASPVWPRHAATHPFFRLADVKKIELEFEDLLKEAGIAPIAGQIERELPRLTANPLFEEVKATILKGYWLANTARVRVEHEFAKERAKYEQIIADLERRIH